MIPDDEPKDWKEEANQQIEELRKSDVEIAIKGIKSHGVEVEKQMSYTQTRKSFVSILDRLTLEKAHWSNFYNL